MKLATAAICLLALGACGGSPHKSPPQDAPAAVAAETRALDISTDDAVQFMASVLRIDVLEEQPGDTVKLFGVGGGDPAMNGLQTYLSFYQNPADGWASYLVGDFLDYRAVSEAAGRVELEIRESVMDEATGHIGDRKRRLIVSWSPPEAGEGPVRVTVQG